VKRSTAPLATCTRRWQARRRDAQSLARWRQISLRWRRGSRRASGAPVVLRPLCVHHVWAPRFEFHEQAAASAARLSGIAFRLAHAARLLVWSRPATATANVAHALRLPHGSPSRDRKLWRGMIGRLSARSDATPTKAVDRAISRQHFRRTPAVRANVPGAAHRSGIVLALARRPARVAASMHGAEASHQFAGLPASTQRARAERPRLSPARPVLLHWRKQESAPSFAAVAAAADATSAHAPPRANATAAPAISSAPAAAATREALRKQPLDATVADRLVDDVVRRLDKRVRVERERRGL